MELYLTILLFLSMILFLFLIGVPVGFAIITASIFLMFCGYGGGLNSSIIVGKLFRSLDKFILLAIPFFIFAGKIMNSGGMTHRIFSFSKAIIGNLKGGLGHVNVLASMIFAGMSGTATGDAAGLGAIEYYSMTTSGYPKEFSVGITAASSIIGPIIPPSIPLVIYAILSNTSVGGMLIAGLLPGVILGLVLMCMCTYFAKKYNYPTGEKFNKEKLLKATKEGIWALGTPAIILIAIVTGIVTITEASALAVFYSIFVVVFIYKELSIKEIWGILKDSMIDSSIILFLLSASGLYSFLIMHARLPILIAEKFLLLTDSPVILLMLINIFLLIVGMFMETASALTILVPVLLPLALKMGIDPTHLGVVMVFNLVVGVVTPPFGQVLFVLDKVCKDIDLLHIVRAVLRFFIPLIITLLLITYFPALSTTLPKLFGLL